MATVERDSLLITKDSSGNQTIHYPITKVDNVDGAVASINGIKPNSNGNVVIEIGGGMPVGFEYFQVNPNIPAGSLPLLGETFSRTIYADLWAWVQTQTNYLISETEWQSKLTANGSVPFYSTGDGSTTFRVPKLSVWTRGATGISEIGTYLPDTFKSHTHNIKSVVANTSGASVTKSAIDIASVNTSENITNDIITVVANGSTETKPKTIVGLYCVIAYGTTTSSGSVDLNSVQEMLEETKKAIETANLDKLHGKNAAFWR